MLTVWAGRRESFPLAIVRSLAAGVPVVAYDVRYGPAELITAPGDRRARALGGRQWADFGIRRRVGTSPTRGPTGSNRAHEVVLAAAGAVLRRTEPRGSLVALDGAWPRELADQRAATTARPASLVESLTTTHPGAAACPASWPTPPPG